MSNVTRAANNLAHAWITAQKITIIGAGWSGLTCAYELLKRGYTNVKIVEAAPQAGGRARAVNFGQTTIDNGQHLLIEGYEHTLKLLAEINPKFIDDFNVLPFEIWAQNLNEKFHFKLINYKFLPHLINLLISVIVTASFSLKDKFCLLKFAIAMKWHNFTLTKDSSVVELLKQYGFSEQIIKHFFIPLVVSTMTTPFNLASAQVFLNILHIAFFKRRHASNFLIAKTDLTTLFVKPLVDQILSLGGKIEYNQLINKISLTDGLNNKIYLHSHKNHAQMTTDLLIITTPPWQTKKLISDIPQLATLEQQLSYFSFEAITSVYLEFADELKLSKPLVGIIGGHTHWLFNHSAGNKNIACIVISSSHQLEIHADNKEQLIEVLLTEIRQVYTLPEIINIKYIQEKRAAFSCTPYNNACRPNSQTNLSNIVLAGDYIVPGYPSTLESAIISAKMAIQQLVN